MIFLNDLDRYDAVFERLLATANPEPESDHSGLYNEFMPAIFDFLEKDFFVGSDTKKISILLSSLSRRFSGGCFSQARETFCKKNAQRGGLWKGVGLVGVLVELHAKMARLEVDGFDEDSKIDLVNYVIIGQMCLDLGLLKTQKERKVSCLVTGAHSGGLGEIILQTLALNGFEVFSLPREELSSLGRIKEFFESHTKAGGSPFSLVINNFGRNKLNWIGEIGEEDLSLFGSNIMAPIAVVNEVVRMGVPCRILNVASQTYRVAQRCTSVYCSTKAALVQFTKVAARELAPKGYVINAIAPGKIEDTKMSQMTDKQVLDLRGWSKEEADRYSCQNTPAGRNTSREEVALAILKILHLPSYINGTVIDMTGGQ